MTLFPWLHIVSRTILDTDFKSLLVADGLYVEDVFCSCLHVRFHFWKTYRKTSSSWTRHYALFPTLSGELGREDWLLRASPVLLAVGTLCLCHPSAPWREVWQEHLSEQKVPCNLWGHKNPCFGKKEKPIIWHSHVGTQKTANQQGRTNIFVEEFGQWRKGESPLKSNIEALLSRSFYWMSEVKPSFSLANSKYEKKKKNSLESS